MENKKLTYRLDGKDYQIDKPVMDYLDKVKKDMEDMKKESMPETPKSDEIIETPMPPEMGSAEAIEKIKSAEMALKTIQEKFGFNSIEEMKSVLDAQKVLIEGLKAQAQTKPVEAVVEAMVEDSIRVIRNAENLKIKTDGLKISDIKKAIIKQALPTMKIDSLDVGALEIVYNTALEFSKNATVKNDSEQTIKHDSDIDKMLAESKEKYFNRGLK